MKETSSKLDYIEIPNKPLIPLEKQGYVLLAMHIYLMERLTNLQYEYIHERYSIWEDNKINDLRLSKKLGVTKQSLGARIENIKCRIPNFKRKAKRKDDRVVDGDGSENR